MTSSYAWWERHGPRLPSHGIRAQTQRGAFGKSWWASRWIAALERLVNPGRLARGRTYARAGQVVSLDIARDGVTARVQGSEAQPYSVHLRFTPLADDEWNRVIDAMSGQALYAARLLSGEMPETIEEVFTSVGVSLFPARGSDMVTTCTCADWRKRLAAIAVIDGVSVDKAPQWRVMPCKHIAAVHYLLGERFDEDPFLMFLLRGRSQEEIVAALRARRAGPEEPEGAAPGADDAFQPDLAIFWTGPPQTEEVALHFALPESDALAIKRLGPPAFVRDHVATTFTGVMERLYQQIGEYALLLALGEADVGLGLTNLRPPAQQDAGPDQREAQ
ncbi:MAG: hypothetical protein JO020_10625 [Chloroflexi bacterium]|nr:hypothetical protein [Chloroflexota bacterium]MBV9133225.1 hypothetical protein [Chloroflexota bacterium]MBV9894614.1 hypothetical protein [Chloroflexota bacterium]